MKKNLLLLICTSISISVINAQSNKNDPNNSIKFRINKGQVCDQNNNSRSDVLFSGSAGDLAFHLKKNGISYQLQKTDSWKTHKDSKTNEDIVSPEQNTIYRLDVNWLNTKQNGVIQKSGRFEGYENFYFAHCPDGVLNVYSYEEIVYKELYKGIDLKWYGKEGNLKYDYIVSPGADYKSIQLQVEGAEKIFLDKKGNLILKTPLGTITEQAPVVIQNEKILPSKWVLKNNVVSFDIKNIDPSKSFIIDPSVGVRQWGTYYGGSGNEMISASSIDSQGNVYLTGYTTSSVSTIIATSGSHQNTFAGAEDAFLTRFNTNGVRIWSTYYGGIYDEYGQGTCTDAFGKVYLTGWTNSSSAIATPGAHKTVGGGADAFLVQFDTMGVRQWGTYYGSAAYDEGRGCATDAFGNVYLIGLVNGSAGTATDIATPGAHQSTFSGGSNDGFLVKFDINGVRQWGTYYGGIGTDYAYGCETDVNGNIFLTGQTNSPTSTLIASPGSYQTNFGGSYDAYLAKFDGNGNRLWSTYYGGSGSDCSLSCNITPSGSIIIAGYTGTNSGTVMCTSGAHQTIYGGGTFDACITIFDQLGNRIYGTYYGGSGDDYFWSSAYKFGSIYSCGYTASTNSISTISSYQTFKNSGYDCFLVRFDSLGVRQWGTYYGGSGDDRGYSCVADPNNNIFISGRTTTGSATTIATSPAHQVNYGGGVCDGFLVKLSDCTQPNSPGNITSSSSLTICAGNSTTLSASVASGIIKWYNAPSNGALLGTGINYATLPLFATSAYYAEAFTCGPSISRTQITVTVSPNPTINIASSGTVCIGESTTLTATGCTSYSWSQGPTTSSVLVSPTITTTYSVSGTDANSCFNSTTVTINAISCVGIGENVINDLFSLYPNPTSSIIHLQFEKEAPTFVEIRNVLGQLLFVKEAKEKLIEIDLKGYQSGFYFVTVKLDGFIKTSKVIKE